MKKHIKVLFCSSEVLPFAKTGGLADVAGSLPIELEKLGVDLRITMPKYKGIDSKVAVIGKDIKVHFIENDGYFSRDDLYGNDKGDFTDNLERFVFYSKESLKLPKDIGFKPDIIHCNDWQSALISIYLKNTLAKDEFYSDIKSIFTIHNLSYQGMFAKSEFEKLGLDWDLFSVDGLEYYNKVNLMKGALLFSDVITTVSPTYAKEIQTKEYGHGLEGVLTKRSESLVGILNGLDYKIWNPLKDKLISKRYTFSRLNDKYINKRSLQRQLGLEINDKIPLFGIISRMVDQKGVDILIECFDKMLKEPLQFILLGKGEQKYQEFFKKVQRYYDSRVAVTLDYDDVLAQQIYAGSDVFLMPSKYEPCGLGQLISLKYGTVPLVRNTGGLADTIIDSDENPEHGNGFTFSNFSNGDFLDAVSRTLKAYNDKIRWKSIIQRGMNADFSWKKSARKYLEIYRHLIHS